MSEAQVINAIGGILLAVLSWIGIRIFSKLDKLSDQMSDIKSGLQAQIVDGDNILHHRVTELDRRVTRVETRCQIEHGAGQ